MFNITETARTQIAEYFKDKEIKPVRIFLSQGCGGAQLAMALDEEKANDIIYTLDGIQYVMEKEFLDQAQPIEVDFSENGFKVFSSLDLGAGCSNCGSKGQCCS